MYKYPFLILVFAWQCLQSDLLAFGKKNSIYGHWTEVEHELDSLFDYIFINPFDAQAKIRSSINASHGVLPDTILARYYSILGISYAVVAHKDSAIYAFNQALKLRPMVSSFSSNVKKNLGNVYRNSGDIDKAFDYYYAALSDALVYKNNHLISVLYGEISSTYSLINKPDFAIEYLQMAIKEFDKIDEPDSTDLAIFHQKLANVYIRQKDWEMAKRYYEMVLPKVKGTNRRDVYFLSLINLSSVYFKQNNVEKALELLDESQVGIEDYSFINLRTLLYSKYVHIYFNLGNKDSLEYYFAKMMEGFNTQDASHLAILLEYVELLRVSGEFSALSSVFEIIEDSPGVVDVFYALDRMIYFKIKAYLDSRQGRNEEAYQSLQMSMSISENLLQTNASSALHGLARKAEVEQQMQQKVIYEQQAQLSNRRSLLIILLLVFVLFVSVYILRLKDYRQRILTLENQRLENLYKQEAERSKVQKKEYIDTSNENLLLKEKLNKVIKKRGEDIDLDLSQWTADNQLLQSVIKRSELLESNWLDNLKLAAPNLSRSELEFCLLLHLGLSYKDIAQLLNISHSSVHTKKYRLCKKINLPPDADLLMWLSQITNNPQN
jgi:tetratricopeptide (TPR) repeat protein